MSYSKAIILGRVGQEPKLSTLQAGTQVCKFSVATTKGYKKKTGEWENITTWHNIAAWGKLAERCNQNVTKGAQIFIEGELSINKYTNKDGIEVQSPEITASNVVFIKNNIDKNNALKTADDKKEEYKVDTDANFASDDIPF